MKQLAIILVDSWIHNFKIMYMLPKKTPRLTAHHYLQENSCDLLQNALEIQMMMPVEQLPKPSQQPYQVENFLSIKGYKELFQQLPNPEITLKTTTQNHQRRVRDNLDIIADNQRLQQQIKNIDQLISQEYNKEKRYHSQIHTIQDKIYRLKTQKENTTARTQTPAKTKTKTPIRGQTPVRNPKSSQLSSTKHTHTSMEEIEIEAVLQKTQSKLNQKSQNFRERVNSLIGKDRESKKDPKTKVMLIRRKEQQKLGGAKYVVNTSTIMNRKNSFNHHGLFK